MLNHAFLIMVHKSPKLFARIVNVLAQANHYFFVHVDAKADDFDRFKNAVSDVPNVIFIDRIRNYHGSVTQIYCELNLYKAALSYVIKMDYFHLISGQDYPLRSNYDFDHFFETHQGQSFACIEGQKWHDKMMQHSYPMRTQIYHSNNGNKILLFLLRLTWRLQLKL